MKLLLMLIVTAFFMMPNLLLAQVEWTRINDGPPAFGLAESCVRGKTIWFLTEENVIYKTSDRGQTYEFYTPFVGWDENLLGTVYSKIMTFADEKTGFISNYSNEIFRTVDGGKNWEVIDESSIYSHIHFCTDQVGWKAGIGRCAVTTDQGETWNNYTIPDEFDGIVTDFYSIDSTKAWIISRYHFSKNVGGKIFYTSDGGRSWQKQNTGFITSEQSRVDYYYIRMLPTGYGVTAGTIYREEYLDYKFFIQVTGNFGNTWVTNEYYPYYPKGVHLLNDSTFIVIAYNTDFSNREVVMYKTTDKGLLWEKKVLNDEYLSVSHFVPDLNTLYLDCSKRYVSYDLGESFEEITTPLGGYLNKLAIEKNAEDEANQIVFAGGLNGEFIISEDRGETWNKKRIQADSVYRFSEIKISEGIIYVIMYNSIMLKSTDHGDSWKRIYLPDGNLICRGLAVHDKNNLCVYSYNKFYLSSDGGESWNSKNFPENFYPNFATMPDSSTYIAAGVLCTTENHHVIYTTHDDGETYSIFESENEIIQVEMMNKKTGYAISMTDLFITRDGGDNWNKLFYSRVSPEYIYAIGFIDSCRGILYMNGSAYKTSDQGKIWKHYALNYPFSSIDQMAVSGDNLLFTLYEGELWKADSIFIEEEEKKIEEVAEEPVIDSYRLYQNYPNPFNSETEIRFDIKEPGYVSLKVYDILGELVEEIIGETLEEGTYRYSFNIDNLASGIYYCSLEIKNYRDVIKMVNLK